GNRLTSALFLLHRVMAAQAQALRSDALDAQFFRDFVRFLAARQVAKRLEMMRILPGFGLLLVAYGTGVRTDHLAWSRRNGAVCGEAEDQQAAKAKRPRPQTRTAIRSRDDSDLSPLLRPF